MRDFDTFYRVARFLQKTANTQLPFSVRRLDLGDNLDGVCELKKGKFVVKVHKNLNENHAIDVLLHEVAHAVAWERDKDVHGTNWGIAYSKIYRLFLEEFVRTED